MDKTEQNRKKLVKKLITATKKAEKTNKLLYEQISKIEEIRLKLL